MRSSLQPFEDHKPLRCNALPNVAATPQRHAFAGIPFFFPGVSKNRGTSSLSLRPGGTGCSILQKALGDFVALTAPDRANRACCSDGPHFIRRYAVEFQWSLPIHLREPSVGDDLMCSEHLDDTAPASIRRSEARRAADVKCVRNTATLSSPLDLER